MILLNGVLSHVLFQGPLVMRAFAFFFAVAAGLFVGCSSEPSRVSIRGKVTLDGKSLEKGLVEFLPADGKTPTAKGGVIVDGEYTADVVPGDVLVKIHSSKVVGKKKRYDTPDSPIDEVTEEAIPKKYNEETTLKEKITADRKEINFDLKSQ